MQFESRTLDFALLLASSAHDMKNSLSMLLNSLEEMIDEQPPVNDAQARRYATLRGEAARINNDLVSLLGLYRIQHHRLSLRVDEVFVRELLEDQAAQQSLLLSTRNIEVEIDCPEHLVWYFDPDLVSGVLANVIVNAARYSQDRIRLSAVREGDWLKLQVRDNGPGFPAAMLSQEETEDSISFNTGSTRLGLHFAAQLANLHERGGRKGYIQLENDAEQSGGIFSLYLP